jgi:ornithine cyclodeaminase
VILRIGRTNKQAFGHPIIHVPAELVAKLGSYGILIEAIRRFLEGDFECPVRSHHSIGVPGGGDATLLTMPAWQTGRYLGVKLANVFPGNSDIGLPSVSAIFTLFDASNGRLLAILDGGELTARRTAAASALASGILARRDCTTLAIIGTGRIAGHLARAHCVANPDIERILVWGRTHANAAALAKALQAEGLAAEAKLSLPEAVGKADIVSAATLSADPLIKGEYLRAGTHVDLVGGFTPQMREADDQAILKATLFCDADAALSEAGDLAQPLARGLITPEQITTLVDLCRGGGQARTSAEEITLFKSVGFAAEDLAAAIAIYEQLNDDAI